MNLNKIIYWVSTTLLGVLLLMSAGMYIFNYLAIEEAFKSFGYPTYLIYPLAIAKTTAVLVLVIQKQSIIKEWVYSALFFEIVLAFFAHFMIGDGEQTAAVIAMALLILSYIFGKRTFKNSIV
ncbi:DoxX family protein [Lutibacter aestuarii]|uniref:DoxX family protein n=1 Tax=Lutibacter aestuarii TaxID=861111 RepID=A0ABW2Z946_9FLAO|nr:DoxX family protein [uncultured Lutibacter sp.]